ncbi:pentapeptide repeat-containing protein [Helicobacter typhlonius]|uniref:pentapeptide repeat-containing protein n=1 Tax=Helicobacter typhlonius TaxID=76936 RepID=UPI00262752F7|nr:pentapeptide repeat-containing protein [uncultured Helicobacter sp.]
MNDIKEKIADYINQHKSSLLYNIDHRSIEQSVMGLINGNKAAGNILNIDDTTIKERVYKEIGQQETKQALQIKEEGVVVYSQNSFVVSPRPAVYHDNGTTQPPQQQEKLQINSFDMRILSKYKLIFKQCELKFELNSNYPTSLTFHHQTMFFDCVFNAEYIIQTLSTDVFAIKNCTFNKNVYFSNAKFCNNVYFNNSHFKGYADFHECEFEKTACFYGATFDNPPNFSQAIFKENLNFVNVKCDFEFENLKERIKQEKEQDSKKTLDKFANDFRDSFRLIKNALIKDNNLLDASNFHKYELYCKEIELDSKNPKTFSKDWIDKIQLCFYRKLCNHHTDLILNLKWLVITIGLFTILFFASKIIQGKEILNLNHYGIALSASSCIMIVLLCLFDYLKLLGGFAYLNLVATLWLVCYNPKLIFGVVNILGDSCFNSFENIVMVTYTIMMFLVLFSLQKTARKNSIIPH